MPVIIDGGTIAQRPSLGEELTVLTKSGVHVNIGQVKSAAYEEGSGTGFIVKATAIRGDHAVYLKLANPKLRIPLIWS
ncbi:MAG TPA: hypothetical protein VLE47_04125 [Candidatus Saccharimonadales bacterium]|nr:hypothetical protein [Candidatus Saccharimonadales bacterium]